MRADNSRHLTTAARQRAEQTRARAVRALRRLDETGKSITFEAVAAEAGVSRSWLYSQQDIRAEIQALRTRRQPSPAAPLTPQRQRATEASLLRRLEATSQRMRHLEEDNRHPAETSRERPRRPRREPARRSARVVVPAQRFRLPPPGGLDRTGTAGVGRTRTDAPAPQPRTRRRPADRAMGEVLTRLVSPLDDARALLHHQDDARYRRASAHAAGVVLQHCADTGRNYWGWTTTD